MNVGGTVNAGGTVTNSGTLHIYSGTTLDLGASFALAGAGTFTLEGRVKTANVSSSALPYLKSWGGTVEYYNSVGGQKIVTGTYNNLVMSNTSGTNTAQGVMYVNDSLVNAGGIFSTSYMFGGSLPYVANAGTISTSVKTTTSSTPIPSGVNWTGTVIYSTSGQTVVPGTYQNLTLSNNSSTTPDVATGDLIVNGAFNTVVGGLLNMGTNLLNVSGTVVNAGIIQTSNTSASPISSGFSWGGTVKYVGSSQTVVAGTYNILSISGTSSKCSAAGGLTVNSSLVISAGDTLNMAGNDLGGTLTTATTSGVLLTSSTSSTPLPSSKSWLGTIVYSAPSGGQTVVAGSYASLTSLGSGRNVAAGAVSVTAALNISSGDTLDMSINRLMGTVSSPNCSGTLMTAVVGTISHVPLPAGKNWAGTVVYSSTSGGQNVMAGTYGNLICANTSGIQTANVNVNLKPRRIR